MVRETVIPPAMPPPPLTRRDVLKSTTVAAAGSSMLPHNRVLNAADNGGSDRSRNVSDHPGKFMFGLSWRIEAGGFKASSRGLSDDPEGIEQGVDAGMAIKSLLGPPPGPDALGFPSGGRAPFTPGYRLQTLRVRKTV